MEGEATVAAIMEGDVVALPISLTVQQAVEHLRSAPRQSLHYLYVTDADRRLAGVLGMRDLLLSPPQDPLRPVVRHEVTSVRPETPLQEVAEIMTRTRYLALPVVDGEGRLLGVVRQDRVLGAVQEGAFEDLRRLVGAGGDERA